MITTSQLRPSSLTPNLRISACGLSIPSLDRRLGQIVARIRLVHHRKVELLKNIQHHKRNEMQMLLDMLDSQSEQITEKAQMIRMSLYCMLLAIAALLSCAVFAGADELSEWVGTAALGCAMRELSLALEHLQAEKEHPKVVTELYLEKSWEETTLKVAEDLKSRMKTKLTIVPGHFDDPGKPSNLRAIRQFDVYAVARSH